MDGDDRLVEVWTPDAELPVIQRERLVWQATTSPFTLAELFRSP